MGLGGDRDGIWVSILGDSRHYLCETNILYHIDLTNLFKYYHINSHIYKEDKLAFLHPDPVHNNPDLFG